MKFVWLFLEARGYTVGESSRLNNKIDKVNVYYCEY